MAIALSQKQEGAEEIIDLTHKLEEECAIRVFLHNPSRLMILLPFILFHFIYMAQPRLVQYGATSNTVSCNIYIPILQNQDPPYTTIGTFKFVRIAIMS